jgi:hypothetical protein
MPKANGGKEYPSSPGPNVAARESQNHEDLRIEEPPLTRNESPPISLALGAGAASVPAGGVADLRLLQPAASAKTAPNEGHRRDPDPVYSIPFDGWVRELDDVLTDFCRRGRDGEREAIDAIRKQYPQISSATIWARIRYLGLTSCKRPPYQRHPWSPEELALLGAGYSSDGRNGASHTTDVLLERHPDWSRSVVAWKAKALGLSHRRKSGYQRWSEDADRKLISCEGFQLESVEKRMKRTKGSIWSRLLALDRGAEFFGGFKTKDLMERLHLDESAIRRLKRQGVLRSERGRITEESVKSLCKDHPEEIPFETLSPDWQHRLIQDYEYRKPRQAPKGGRKKKQVAAVSAPESVG